MRFYAIIVVSALFATAPIPAMAECLTGHCSISKPLLHFDKRAKVEKDCSFSDAGNGWDTFISGETATDIGGGRIGQRWSVNAACVQSESVVVVDCTTKEFIQIRGVCAPPDPDKQNSFGRYLADYLYPPHGKLRLDSKTTVKDLVKLSQSAKYDHWTDAKNYLSKPQGKNRINPYCGCKLYYPDSPGAKL